MEQILKGFAMTVFVIALLAVLVALLGLANSIGAPGGAEVQAASANALAWSMVISLLASGVWLLAHIAQRTAPAGAKRT
jgi:hypothetical protein